MLDDEHEWRRVTAQDRCDKCAAQAYVVTRVYGTDMLWCAHDFREGEAKLVKVATRIWDFRFLLEEEA
jgi:hypothetical protein